MNTPYMLRRAGANSIILYFGTTIDPQLHHTLMNCHDSVLEYLGQGILSLIPSYASLLIRYDPLIWNEEELIQSLDHHCQHNIDIDEEASILVEIPVWYDPSVGWDLENVASHKHLTIDEIVAIHSHTEYRVYAVGFLPGFGYMGELDERLKTPRLSTPRSNVPAGSVAIADRQTAVYPAQSPGGWHLLGRTPLEMFDLHRESASILHVGMRVRFVPIDREQYLSLGGQLP